MEESEDEALFLVWMPRLVMGKQGFLRGFGTELLKGGISSLLTTQWGLFILSSFRIILVLEFCP